MDEGLRELYQEVIIDHGRHPRNFTKMKDYDRCLEGYNPLCGDRIELYLQLKNDKVINASFQGAGCAISIASASLMTEQVKGKSIEESQHLFQEFHALLTQQSPPTASLENLGKLCVLGGVSEFPSRVKRATLAWHILHTALKDKDTSQTITTE